VHRLIEGETDLGLEVAAVRSARTLFASAAEERREDVAEVGGDAPPREAATREAAAEAAPASYCLRFSESERVSYACWISLKRSSAAGSSGFRSGCHFRASSRYAFLISAADADLPTPSTS
jgi:hypothetical protein